jgi:hypothetical protein
MTGKNYEVVSVSDGSFAVVIRTDHELPRIVESFNSAEAARIWIDHQPERQAGPEHPSEKPDPET